MYMNEKNPCSDISTAVPTNISASMKQENWDQAAFETYE
jgi:hypothetical protein